MWSRALSTGMSRPAVPMTIASSSSQSSWFETVGRATASPGPMIDDDGLMNSFGTITVLSTRCPPPSSMWAWKLPATASSLPGRRIGASSSTELERLATAGIGRGARGIERRRPGLEEHRACRRRYRPPDASTRSTIVSSPASPMTAPDGGCPSGPRKVARRMVAVLLRRWRCGELALAGRGAAGASSSSRTGTLPRATDIRMAWMTATVVRACSGGLDVAPALVHRGR